ncbi:hypothetical protein ASG81_05995 [Paenibacillus sp. Soil522]|nr:hypothetical protein ASG81_05995 [Paenibacillus sp. Soil522]
MSGTGTANGTNLQIWAYTGGANQKWKFLNNGDGTYQLSNSNSNKVLDVNGSGTTNGTNVQIWTSNSNLGQKWKLVWK